MAVIQGWMSFSRLLREKYLAVAQKRTKKPRVKILSKDVSEIKVLREGGIIPNNNVDLYSH